MGRLLLQACRVPCLGQSRNRSLDGGRLRRSANARCPDLYLDDFYSLTEVQGLGHSTDARTAMHTLDAKCELGQFRPLCLLSMIRQRRGCKAGPNSAIRLLLDKYSLESK